MRQVVDGCSGANKFVVASVISFLEPTYNLESWCSRIHYSPDFIVFHPGYCNKITGKKNPANAGFFRKR